VILASHAYAVTPAPVFDLKRAATEAILGWVRRLLRIALKEQMR
jgi:hypothetical protein